MKKIVVLFSGEGSNLSYIINNLHQKKLEIAAAFTDNPRAGGISFVQKENIPFEIISPTDFGSREEYDKFLAERIAEYSPDLTVLAGFMRILGPAFTDNVRAVNLHPSLLPRHKGLNAIRKSYDDDYPEGGVTVHWVNSELDGGEIIRQKSISKEGMSFDEYERQIRTVEKKVLTEAIMEVLDTR